MVWGAFSEEGKLDLVMIDKKCNSEKCCDMLSNNLLPCIEDEFVTDPWFQQDNASIHVSRYSKKWFEDNGVDLLHWPALSPDLNPMKNLWGILSNRLCAEGKQYATVGELRGAIFHE